MEDGGLFSGKLSKPNYTKVFISSGHILSESVLFMFLRNIKFFCGIKWPRGPHNRVIPGETPYFLQLSL